MDSRVPSNQLRLTDHKPKTNEYKIRTEVNLRKFGNSMWKKSLTRGSVQMPSLIFCLITRMSGTFTPYLHDSYVPNVPVSHHFRVIGVPTSQILMPAISFFVNLLPADTEEHVQVHSIRTIAVIAGVIKLMRRKTITEHSISRDFPEKLAKLFEYCTYLCVVTEWIYHSMFDCILGLRVSVGSLISPPV